jgi:hypothetical protein
MDITRLAANISPTCAGLSETTNGISHYIRRFTMRRHLTVPLFAVISICASVASALAAEPCAGFKWNVQREHALFVGAAESVPAGKDSASAPAIGTDRLYELKLSPQDEVAFLVPPGKKMLTDGAYAGLASFEIKTSGTYRVSVDIPFWIDIVADAKLVTTKDFQGQRGCDAPHKIVEYELVTGGPFALQLSGATTPSVRLTITKSPAATP